MADNSAEIASFIKEITKLSCAELMRYFERGVTVRSKPDDSLVTEADLASEAVVVEGIRKKFPHDVICSEESGLSSTERTPGKAIWIVDPLDGTTNFANGYPCFCVSIARGVFDDRGRIRLTHGAIGDPVRQKTYLAEAGRGAKVNDRPMRVRVKRPLKAAFLVTGFYYNTGDVLAQEVERFHRIAKVCSSIRRDGSAALDMAMAAEGVFDAFWELGLKPWDVAAGALLVLEAGGTVVNYPPASGFFDVEGPGVICGSSDAVTALKSYF